ncbi:nuclear transport factor 2 family protein [Flavobacterium sp.]|jgi:hypothetical protein|uniref:nuclear transport factor 2 family protein n=1 Tax=Flavobacterium sp. TaxID=239 RepID=UPI0037C0211B
MSPKELVQSFYQSDALFNSKTLDTFLHPEVVLEWNSSKGFLKKDRQGLLQMANDLKIGYETFVVQIHQIVAEDNLVSVHYTHFGTTIENPNQINRLAYFFAIWEIQDGKLYRGYQMSQLP